MEIGNDAFATVSLSCGGLSDDEVKAAALSVIDLDSMEHDLRRRLEVAHD